MGVDGQFTNKCYQGLPAMVIVSSLVLKCICGRIGQGLRSFMELKESLNLERFKV